MILGQSERASFFISREGGEDSREEGTRRLASLKVNQTLFRRSSTKEEEKVEKSVRKEKLRDEEGTNRRGEWQPCVARVLLPERSVDKGLANIIF